MKKRIILIDGGGFLLETLSKMEDVEIVMLVYGSERDLSDLEKIKKKYGEQIKYYYPELFKREEDFIAAHETDYELTPEDVENYRFAQLKMAYFGQRFLRDDASIQYRYFAALRFFLGFFQKEKIDMVFDCTVEHGSISDSLIFEIAKKMHIPCYVSVTDFFHKMCIKNYNENKLLDITTAQLPPADFKGYFDFLVNYANSYRIRFLGENKLQYLRFAIKSFIYHTNYLMTKLKDQFLGKYCCRHTVSKKERADGYVYISKLHKYYEKLAKKPELTVPYIYYSLHQEPEASFMNRNWMTNQLYIIQLLSETLPTGWKLYVKEHPSQFNIYERWRPLLFNFYIKVQYYRAPNFYEQILRFKNTELIGMRTNSSDLITHAQAVASICGTVLEEAVARHKSVLIFGRELIWVEKLKEANVVSTRKEIREALRKIQQKPHPEYVDAQEVFSKYSFCAGENRSHYHESWEKALHWLLKMDER